MQPSFESNLDVSVSGVIHYNLGNSIFLSLEVLSDLKQPNLCVVFYGPSLQKPMLFPF